MGFEIKGTLWAFIGESGEASHVYFSNTENAPYGEDYVKIADHTINVAIPEGWDPRREAIAAAQAEMTKAAADYRARVTELTGRINRLLSLGHDTKVEGVEVYDPIEPARGRVHDSKASKPVDDWLNPL